ncbi:MAG: PAS domain S-box protein [Deltaproteobacteria bacterium]|nr:PAS domain S-box protein [Deltaproteobacteria bacterium]
MSPRDGPNNNELEAIRAEALDFAGIGLYRYRWDGVVLFMDRGALRILGLEGRFADPKDVVGRDIADLIRYSGPRGFLRSRLRAERRVRGLEYPFQTLDGEERWAEHDSYVTTDPATGEEQLQVIIRNITKRKRLEQGLAAEHERLAVTLRSIGDGVITTGTDGRVTLVNRAAEALTGWPQEEAVGRPLDDVFRIIDQRTREPRENPVAHVLRCGGVVGIANHTALLARDGRERVIADSAAPIRDPQSRTIGVVLVFRDVTDKERMQADMLRIERLQSLGVLAGGIAHDFNNLLAAILGNVGLGRLYAGPGSQIGDLLEEAEKATLRAKDLTRQLLTFARGGEPARRTTALGALVRDAAQFALHGSTSSCDFDIAPDLHQAEVDPGQISQVVHNLVLNAVQAMEQGGRIELVCRNVTVEPASALPLPPGPYVSVAVRDHGPGIPDERLAAIFEPYYTTKPRGTGLGLTIVHSIVLKHDGHVRVESRVGEGSTFVIWLPASLAAAESPPPVSRTALGGTGRVLLMDDDPAVLDVGAQMLRHLGYGVDTATDGQAALRLYGDAHAAGRSYDAVLLDLTVPGGMGGAEAIRRILALDAEAVAVACSGYSSDPILANPRAFGFRDALAKPYDISALGRTLVAVGRKT